MTLPTLSSDFMMTNSLASESNLTFKVWNLPKPWCPQGYVLEERTPKSMCSGNKVKLPWTFNNSAASQPGLGIIWSIDTCVQWVSISHVEWPREKKWKRKRPESSCVCLGLQFLWLMLDVGFFLFWHNQLHWPISSNMGSVHTYLYTAVFARRLIIIIIAYLLRTHWAPNTALGPWSRENLFLAKSLCFHPALGVIAYLRK